MNCEQFQAVISHFIDGLLSTSQKSEFLQHRKICMQCEQVFSEIQTNISAMKNAPTISPSYDFNQKLFRRIEIEPTRKKRSFRIQIATLPLAATLLILAGWMFFHQFNSTPTVAEQENNVPETVRSHAIQEESDIRMAGNEIDQIDTLGHKQNAKPAEHNLPTIKLINGE
ncbi:hypothetical protein H8D59_03045 [bacterium]|nr:hypothetical protein [bacterium]